jgi:hypothetical protein
MHLIGVNKSDSVLNEVSASNVHCCKWLALITENSIEKERDMTLPDGIISTKLWHMCLCPNLHGLSITD